MGEHNNAMCRFFVHAEYYADFWNGVIFQGRQEIKAEDEILLGMELMDTIDYTMPIRKLLYDAQEYRRRMKSVIRCNRAAAKRQKENCPDKYWKHSGEFLYGLRKGDTVPPLITVALYCGKEKYDGCKDLSDMLQSKQIGSEYKKWINGYPLHLIVLQDLEEEYQFDSLQTRGRGIIIEAATNLEFRNRLYQEFSI